jgi:hypothetical protein
MNFLCRFLQIDCFNSSLGRLEKVFGEGMFES